MNHYFVLATALAISLQGACGRVLGGTAATAFGNIIGNVVQLSSADFEEGTYRITEPGRYVLTEDIEFGPQEWNDYWPPMSLWGKYPPSAYYLGFFAALTVEADDVVIDLGGSTIQQSEDFYLLQRFFNVIELNDRVFVNNEVIASLKYQKSDT